RDDAVLDSLAHAVAQRIHWRIVDGDDGDIAVATQTDWIVQDGFLESPFPQGFKFLIAGYVKTRALSPVAIPQCRTPFCTLTGLRRRGGVPPTTRRATEPRAGLGAYRLDPRSWPRVVGHRAAARHAIAHQW